MALITSAAAGPAQTSRTAPKKIGFAAAQALAKQKAYEKKAKRYRLPLGELAIFTQQLASLLTAGLPLVQCLEALQDQTEDPCFRIIIRDVRNEISAGKSFFFSGELFSTPFHTPFVSLVGGGG